MAIVGKILGTTLFYLPTGNGWREGLTVGTGMNGLGAVEIIIAGIGLELGIIDRNIFSILVFMAILTTMTVPVLLKWTTNWLKKRGELVQITNRKGYLMVGVNPISLLLAKYLHQNTPICMIDANRDSVNIARANGYKCIHGNALREDIMFEAGAETIETFIGLTRNSEINILAAQLARETFNIPNNHIILSRNEDGAGIEQMESYSVTSLFAMRINVDAWFNKIIDNEYSEHNDTIKEKLEARNWIKKKNATGSNLLPLLIINSAKNKRVFHFGEELQPGEVVLYLE
jgi:Trk K+ transport system NAD-binding subunit